MLPNAIRHATRSCALANLWKYRIALLSLVALAVFATHCGDSSTTTGVKPSSSTASSATIPAASTTTAPATPTPQALPTEDPIAAAAAQYSPIVADLNVCGAQVSAEQSELPSTAQYSALVPSSRELLACIQAFQAALFQISFPPSVSTQASALAATFQTDIADLQDFITNPDSTTWEAAMNAVAASTSASAAIRIALHLPPPPTE